MERALREALRNAYRVDRTDRSKYKVYVRKKGEKKVIFVVDPEAQTIFVITGTEG